MLSNKSTRVEDEIEDFQFVREKAEKLYVKHRADRPQTCRADQRRSTTGTIREIDKLQFRLTQFYTGLNNSQKVMLPCSSRDSFKSVWVTSPTSRVQKLVDEAMKAEPEQENN